MNVGRPPLRLSYLWAGVCILLLLCDLVHASPKEAMEISLLAQTAGEEMRDPFFNMVRIPAGGFLMGSTLDEVEKPQRQIYLDTFEIDRYEVTASEFAQFLNAYKDLASRYIGLDHFGTIQAHGGGYRPLPALERYPANNVTWFGARAFCQWAGKRLPTEAEWEKAARSGDGRKYPWGYLPPNPEKARYGREWRRERHRVMVPVDSMPEGKSPYGVYHMAGNVMEWVEDKYDPLYYHHGPTSNPKGSLQGEMRVLRGGSWLKSINLRTTVREGSLPVTRGPHIGFRCARTP